MLKPMPNNEAATTTQGKPRRKRRLRTISMLPTLLTLGNLYFGFLAINACGREMYDLGANVQPSKVQTLNSAFFEKRARSYLSIAAWFLVAAMLCDALDGRVARKTGASSMFGKQLDTIADMVSFGAAPALMMITMTYRELAPWEHDSFGLQQFGQAAALIGAVYVCCTALRLARFTVEATPEEASHSGFLGIPSPGAAAAVISLVYLHDHWRAPGGWPQAAQAIAYALPLCTLIIALLMVSRVPYRHFVSWFLRRRPFGHVVLVLLVIPLLWLFTAQVLALMAWAFVASGPIAMLKAKAMPSGAPAEVDADTEASTRTDTETETENSHGSMNPLSHKQAP